MINYLHIDSPEYAAYLEEMNDWSDPRPAIREIAANMEKRIESYARRPEANQAYIHRNLEELKKLSFAYWQLLSIDLPTWKLATDLIREGVKIRPDAGMAYVAVPLRVHGEGEPLIIDLCTKTIV
jgi:hypothetical protein